VEEAAGLGTSHLDLTAVHCAERTAITTVPLDDLVGVVLGDEGPQ